MLGREVKRRFVHLGGAVFPGLYLLDALTWGQLEAIYLAGSALAVGLEVLRLGVGLDWGVFRQLTREYEASNPAGYALYVVSSTAVIVAFEPAIAVPAVLMLAIADPVSGLLADNESGEPKRPLVIAVTFAVAGAIAVPFVPPVPAALGALAATLADGYTPVVAGYVVDDNLTIPVAASLAMWAGLALAPTPPV